MHAPEVAARKGWDGQEGSDFELASIFPDLHGPLGLKEALAEAGRCLECGSSERPAPCMVACPAGVDVPGFVTAIARGDTACAADIIFDKNILGASCARVCPVEQFCEGACVLHSERRRPVEIGRLQRFATETELRKRSRFRRTAKPNGKRVSVIGAGPAGLTCAAELAARGYSVVLYDKNEDHGGLVRYAIAPYRIRRDPLPAEVEMIEELGVEFRLGTGIDTPEQLAAIEAESDAIFLGIGLGADVQLHYPGEELPGVYSSLDFVRAIKTGAPPAVGERVAVIGGGNTAIDVARESLRLGSRDVTLYYRRTRSEMPAYPHEVDEALSEGIHIQFLTTLVAFHGSDRLRSIALAYMQLAEPDGSGRPKPVQVPRTEFEVPADTAILAVGQERRSAFLAWIDGMRLEGGLIPVDPETGQTSNPKYFAGGDSLNGGATAVEAVKNGRTAASGIDRYLGGEGI